MRFFVRANCPPVRTSPPPPISRESQPTRDEILYRPTFLRIPNGTFSHPTMAYNPDAIYGQPLGAQAALPTVSLTRMNEPNQAPQRDRCSKAIQGCLGRLFSLFLR